MGDQDRRAGRSRRPRRESSQRARLEARPWGRCGNLEAEAVIAGRHFRHARLAGRMAGPGHRAALREVLKVVGLEAARVRRIGAAAEGAASRAWCVWPPDGRRQALRCHAAWRKFPEVAYELEVLHYLAGRGWTVPIPSGPPVECGGRVFSLCSWVSGRPLEPSPASDRARGVLLARLHAALWPLADGLGQRPGWTAHPDLERTIASRAWREGLRLVEVADAELAAAVQAAAERTIEEIPPQALAGLPRLLLHGDFADWNVLGVRGIPQCGHRLRSLPCGCQALGIRDHPRAPGRATSGWLPSRGRCARNLLDARRGSLAPRRESGLQDPYARVGTGRRLRRRNAGSDVHPPSAPAPRARPRCLIGCCR